MSLIPNNPPLRDLVQQNFLQREFQDGLLPRFLFRAEVASTEDWPGQAGDTKVFTGDGFIEVSTKPKDPTIDPTPKTYPVEQWSATLYDWKETVDVNMVQSFQAAQSLYLRNGKKLAINGGHTLNRIIRQRLLNPAQAGWTVADGAQTSTVTLRVRRLNGFTEARRPDLGTGSQVRYAPVTTLNPLQVQIEGVGTRNVIGYNPDNPGDVFGPGTVTLDAAVTVADRAAVIARNATWLYRVGTGHDPVQGKIDQITAANLLRLSDLRAGVARFNAQNIEPHADGYIHGHIDPISERQLFGDPELQRLSTGSTLNAGPYLRNVLGVVMGVVLIRNNEMPYPDTVDNGRIATRGPSYWSEDDALGMELWSTGSPATGRPVRRVLLVGDGFLKEYMQRQENYISDAGVMGVVADPDGQVQNNGVVIRMNGVNLMIRAAQNRTMDQVSMTWRFIGDWVGRPDTVVGDDARYKRVAVIEHAAG